jgi:hypothetical protein
MPSANANAVFSQLQDDFPKQDCNWVQNPDVFWSPLSSVPLSKIDFSNEKNWNAYEHDAKLKKFVQKIKSGDRKPVILGKFDGGKLKVLDGHHRTLAHQRLNMPVRAYIATIGAKSKNAAMTMHASQRKGNSGMPVKDRVLKFTAETGVASTVHHPLGTKSLWNLKGRQQLPAYIQNVAHALIRSGSAAGESDAIHKAVGIVEGWARGHAAGGRKVSPTVQAAAARAVAEWEAIRAKTKTHGLSGTPDEEDVIELVGPKGYVHGWIYVGGAGMASVASHYAKLHDVVSNPSKYSKNDVSRAKLQIKDEAGSKVKPKAPDSAKESAKKARTALDKDEAFKHVAEPVSKRDRDAAKIYSVASAAINSTLRRGEKKDARFVKAHKDLDSAFKNATPTTKDIVVHRGLPSSVLGSGNAVGTKITDKGYTSTSTNAAHASGFGGEGDTAVMHITVPAGSKTLKPGSAGQFGDREKEIVLNRGGSYNITGDKMINGQRHVTATYQGA